MMHVYKKYILKIYRVQWKTHINIWSISTRYCIKCWAVCRKCKAANWRADQENISTQQYTYMFFQVMCIRVEIPLNSHTNLLQMQMAHECQKFTPASCRPSASLWSALREGWLTGYIMPFEGKSNYCKLNTSRTRLQWQSCMETLGMDT